MQADDLAALEEVQAYIFWARDIASKTTNPHKRDACLRVAAAIEEQARILDAAASGSIRPLSKRAD